VVCVATVLSPFKLLPSCSVLTCSGGRHAERPIASTMAAAAAERVTLLM
jgi:hypothetical protein